MSGQSYPNEKEQFNHAFATVQLTELTGISVQEPVEALALDSVCSVIGKKRVSPSTVRGPCTKKFKNSFEQQEYYSIFFQEISENEQYNNIRGINAATTIDSLSDSVIVFIEIPLWLTQNVRAIEMQISPHKVKNTSILSLAHVPGSVEGFKMDNEFQYCPLIYLTDISPTERIIIKKFDLADNANVEKRYSLSLKVHFFNDDSYEYNSNIYVDGK